MRQRFESWSGNRRVRSLLSRTVSHTVSGKGLLVQAITYQFALPAIANAPTAIAVLDPAPSDLSADIHNSLPSDFVLANDISDHAIASPREISSDRFVLANPAPDNLATTLVPAAALAEPDPQPLSYTAHTDAEPESFYQTEALPYPVEPNHPVESLNYPTAFPTYPTEFPTYPTEFPTYPIEQIAHRGLNSEPNTEPDIELSAESDVNPDINPDIKPDTELNKRPDREPEALPHSETEIEDSEFSWFSIGDLIEQDNSQKVAFATQLAAPATTEGDSFPLLIAGPQDFNPALSNPSESLPTQSPSDSPNFDNPLLENAPSDAFPPDSNLPSPIEPAPIEEIPAEPFSDEPSPSEQNPFVQWDDLEVGINSEFNNFGESSWSILPVLNGRLANGNQVKIASGFRQFEQDNFESVGHVPLTLGWKGNVNDVELELSGGVDLFNRLPTDTHASAIATAPIGQDASISVSVEQGPHLFNAQTLENGISKWQYGPDFYWQITPKTSLLSKVRIGNYSDRNWEQQSFSRLERTIGEEASVSLNFFNQSFRENVEDTSGYFSPSDFLLATAELSWKEQLTDGLSCGLLGSIGQQRISGEWALAYSGQAICTIDIASALQIDLGYQFNNVSNDQSAFVDDSAYSNQQIVGGIRVRF